MFERFTDRARRVVVLAQEESRLLNHSYIGTEHIRLGLIHERQGVAAQALAALGISLESVRTKVEEIIGAGVSPPAGHIPFTPRAKKVLELSLREATQLGHNYIGTEHILLGLIREGEGVGAQALVKLGADLERARAAVIELLSGYTGPVVESESAMDHAEATVHAISLHAISDDVQGPTCPSCSYPVEESAAVRDIAISDEDADEPRVVSFVYCSRCGAALGLLPPSQGV